MLGGLNVAAAGKKERKRERIKGTVFLLTLLEELQYNVMNNNHNK